MYSNSLTQLHRAETVIPLGAQTVSKSRLTLPPGIMPLYATKAYGCRISDVDGKEYVDLISALAAVNIGYCDPDIDDAVRKQLHDGVTISLSHPVEAELAELLVQVIPSAEMVRFAKNGSDANSAAVRVARAITGKDHVISCGYHGWHDWHIGTSPGRNLGVPESVRALSHPISYNDLESLELMLKSFDTAAIIMEPMNSEWPAEGYLEGVRALADSYGALLIFDEMITGFRFSIGGAQAYFGVTPDLSTFGKGIANGYPLSAIVGLRKYMYILEDVFFSGTFGGELLSLHAAKAVIEKEYSAPFIDSLSAKGASLKSQLDQILVKNKISNSLSLEGHPSWLFLKWNQEVIDIESDLKLLLMQEMAKRNVLVLGTHNIMAAHDESALSIICSAYDQTIPILVEAIASRNPREFLDADVFALHKGVR